ncbi:MAG: HNH endonuclease, partial [Actinobacteria bacterium]|nr:HNH endonuclease [Actinomycetota bacterium]
MEAELEHLSDGELLTVIGRALDVLLSDRTPAPDDRQLLTLLRASLGIGARLEAWQSGLAARAEATEAAWREHGTSTSTWLADAANLTRREAARLV